MNKKDLVAKLKQLEGLTPEERAELINLLNTKKKYGLIWEDKPEDVEEQLRTQLPVLREVVEKRILATKSENDTATPKTIKTNLFTEEENHSSDNGLLSEAEAPNHILIEGDNLHALTALTFTHEGKIDVIYIDPPYNTGNKDFKYNDAFVDKEDSYRHSKWLSFMHKRLEIAKRLVKENGAIFISIDDNEQAQLKLLCDEIFGENNHVATLPVIMNLKGNHDNYGFSDTHEYSLVYTKTFTGCNFNVFDMDEEDILKDWEEDEYGLFKRADTLRRTGQDAARAKRPKGWFPVFIDGDFVYVTDDDLPKKNSDLILWPINEDGDELSWTWQKSKITKEYYNLLVIDGRNGKNVYKKQRPQIGDLPTKKPKSFFYKTEYSTSTATTELKKILEKKKFDGPKPMPFIFDLLLIGSDKSANILDFFAGSGTTLHATMQLNAEDGGNRQCILVTNNENNICEEVTYERNKRVIQGYTNAKGVQVAGLANNNLRYFRSEYVGREKTHKNKRELVLAATELLCIKEDIYTELAELNGHKLDKKTIRCFSDKGSYLMVIYDEETIETLLPLISAIDTHHKIKIYIFAPGQYPFTEEFEDVLDKVELCALPDAIYKAYSNVLPKKKSPKQDVEGLKDGQDEDNTINFEENEV